MLLVIFLIIVNFAKSAKLDKKELVEKAIKLIYRVHQAKKLDNDLQFTIHKELNS